MDEKPKFEPGNIVRLKSDTIRMVISSIFMPGHEGARMYHCVWLDNKARPQFADYRECCLVKIKAP